MGGIEHCWQTISAQDNDRMEAALLAVLDEDDAMGAIQVMREHTVPAATYRGAVEALQSLRAAWDEHMVTCPQHAKLPSFEEITAWMNAPSNTASGGQ